MLRSMSKDKGRLKGKLPRSIVCCCLDWIGLQTGQCNAGTAARSHPITSQVASHARVFLILVACSLGRNWIGPCRGLTREAQEAFLQAVVLVNPARTPQSADGVQPKALCSILSLDSFLLSCFHASDIRRQRTQQPTPLGRGITRNGSVEVAFHWPSPDPPAQPATRVVLAANHRRPAPEKNLSRLQARCLKRTLDRGHPLNRSQFGPNWPLLTPTRPPSSPLKPLPSSAVQASFPALEPPISSIPAPPVRPAWGLFFLPPPPGPRRT